MTGMLKWVCPGCGRVVTARGSWVGHECPAKDNRLTTFIQQDRTQ